MGRQFSKGRSGLKQHAIRYALAFLLFLSSFALRYALQGALGDKYPYLTYYPACAAAALLLGFGPSLMVTLLAIGQAFWQMAPAHGFWVTGVDAQVGGAAFFGFSVIVGYLGHQLRQTTAQSLAQEEWWRVTLRSIGDAVIVTDDKGRVSYLNPVAEMLTGWLTVEAEGAPLDDVFHIINEQSRVPVSNPYHRVMQTGRVQGLANHTILISRGGAETSIADSAAPIVGPSGQLSGVVIVFRDNTLERKRELSLLEAARGKDDFLAMLAHELRNPLAPLQTALDLLQVEARDPAVTEWALNHMRAQLDQLTSIVNDLLDVSRVARGKVALTKKPTDLRLAVQSAVDTIRHPCQFAHLELTLNLPSEPAYTAADPTRLQQVLSNVLNNACKYTPAGGHIDVRLDVAQNDHFIHVADTGLGIDPHLLHRLFTPFVQGDRTLDRAGGGLGLGLAVAQNLAQLHGGEITAHSEGIGKGSRFTIRLPRLPAEDIPAEPQSAGWSRPSMRRARVLIVDDNRSAAVLLERLLRNAWGFETTTAHDGAEALRVAESFLPDLVLLDIGLPEYDGYAVASWFRNNSRLATVPLVAVTGYGSEADRLKTRAAGFRMHLTKPVGINDLERVLLELGLGQTSAEAG